MLVGRRSRDELRSTLAATLPALRQRHPIRSIAVFGSRAREARTATSDVDLVVEVARPIGLLAFLRLKGELAAELGITVDLVTRKGLHPSIEAEVQPEMVLV